MTHFLRILLVWLNTSAFLGRVGVLLSGWLVHACFAMLWLSLLELDDGLVGGRKATYNQTCRWVFGYVLVDSVMLLAFIHQRERERERERGGVASYF